MSTIYRYLTKTAFLLILLEITYKKGANWHLLFYTTAVGKLK